MDPAILCIGSVLWDVIGRSPSAMGLGSDVPGRISRLPGGVALNIAMTLRRFGLAPALLSAVGRDDEGDALIAEIAGLGLRCDLIYRSDDLPTDRYMAIEGAGGLVAAVADAHSLERADARILAPLKDGRLGAPDAPFDGIAALDGNLTEGLLARIAQGPWLARADLRVAPASPGKVARLQPLLSHPRATFYVNLEEARLLLNAAPGAGPATALAAAAALHGRGAARVLVTDGGRSAALADPQGAFDAAPPAVMVARVTGAGDTFMAAHIAAELRGEQGPAALRSALATAASYVSGEVAS
ncbi:PfkB [Oceaniovalibus guishaninsula JLT2003]|uniref:PfkB n=1 Tax=Oceaniovalibus guishaninsula JLT2003 TaxID=1231392 RepID=K2GL28_9RHOB|nr:PfkB family carbohydrate kinase [Oceaniovalibus guishaninsula]EKE43476.1 PfkB [Oceaniovalibus guishaninsula JLT2003]